MPSTIDDRCDWCYGPLEEADLVSPLGDALGSVEAAVCADCAGHQSMLVPPDSLYPADVELSGSEAWKLAIAAFLNSDSGDQELAKLVLRRVAGYG